MMKNRFAALLLALGLLVSASPCAGAEEIKAGQTLTFGHYEQDDNTKDGKEPIEWVVVEVADGQATLLSTHILDAHAYGSGVHYKNWEDSALRKWLREKFLPNAFSAKQKKALVSRSCDNSASQALGDECTDGETTQDLVSVPTYAEISAWAQTEGVSLAAPITEYAIHQLASCDKSSNVASYRQIIMDYRGGCYSWWLRSVYGDDLDSACAEIVTDGGEADSWGSAVTAGDGVRPVIVIDLEAYSALQ